MRLLHYSAEPIKFNRARRYESSGPYKPKGFWLSVEGDDDWASWCLAEGFGIQGLLFPHEVVLEPAANVLVIDTLSKFSAFESEHLVLNEIVYRPSEPDWPMIYERWDGIVIAPYQWSRRLDASWYYGWDCASACIWNLNAIRDVRLLPPSDGAAEKEGEKP